MNALALDRSARQAHPVQQDPSVGSAVGGFAAVSNQSIDRILLAVREHLGTDIAFVSRYVENHEKELTHVSSDLELPMGPGYRDSRDDSYCWHIAQGRLPQLIQDPADHPFTQSLAITDLLPVGCHLNVPIKLSDGTIYGSFCCLSRKPDRSMTERDLGVLKAFATLATEQIENSLQTDAELEVKHRDVQTLLDKKAITILHQAIVDMASSRPVGVECLARFPNSGPHGPDKWFNDAAEVGLGVELEMLAIKVALETTRYLPRDVYASINASPQTILSGELETLLPAYAGRPLVIELTEHQEVEDFAKLKQRLDALRPYARVAIDDVGAGYSGMRHLVDLKPDLLKLDMTLTRDIHRDVARQALTTAMVRFARDIGAKLVAEGVECAEEREALVDLKVDLGQGYFFARPMPVVNSALMAFDGSIARPLQP